MNLRIFHYLYPFGCQSFHSSDSECRILWWRLQYRSYHAWCFQFLSLCVFFPFFLFQTNVVKAFWKCLYAAFLSIIILQWNLLNFYTYMFFMRQELCIGMHCLTPVFAGVGCWLLCCFIEEAQPFFSWTCRGSQAWWEKQSIECTRHNTSIDWNDLLESFRSTLLLGSYASICNTVSHYTLLYLTQEQSSLSEIHLRKNFVSFQYTIWLCWWFCLNGWSLCIWGKYCNFQCDNSKC